KSAATQEARRHQKLLMGPWPHAVNSTRKLGEIDFGPSALIDFENYQLRWFDRWLKGGDADLNAYNAVYDSLPAVRVFVMGANRWPDALDWPLPGTQFVKYYFSGAGKANTLQGDGKLQTQPPAVDSSPDHYRYDPADPVPFLMGETYAQVGGPD